ncbi:MAG TPA: hypothetical protein VGH19_02915 [Verrucomicrobiae bacterium]
MGETKDTFSLKELLLALLVGAGAVVAVYLISFLLLLGALTLLTDWGWLPRIFLSLACAYPLIMTLDLFTDFKDWRRRKLALKQWDERRKRGF